MLAYRMWWENDWIPLHLTELQNCFSSGRHIIAGCVYISLLGISVRSIVNWFKVTFSVDLIMENQYGLRVAFLSQKQHQTYDCTFHDLMTWATSFSTIHSLRNQPFWLHIHVLGCSTFCLQQIQSGRKCWVQCGWSSVVQVAPTPKGTVVHSLDFIVVSPIQAPM